MDKHIQSSEEFISGQSERRAVESSLTKNELDNEISMQELLDGVCSGTIAPETLNDRQKTCAQLYLVSQQGIDIASYRNELPGDYPYRERFQPHFIGLMYEPDHELSRQANQESKAEAKQIIKQDYPQLYDELKQGAEKLLHDIRKGDVIPEKLKGEQKTTAQLFRLVQSGIESCLFHPHELKEDFPYKKEFDPLKSITLFETDGLELFRANEESKAAAARIIERDYPELHEVINLEKQIKEKQEPEFRWPENDDFRQDTNYRGMKM